MVRKALIVPVVALLFTVGVAPAFASQYGGTGVNKNKTNKYLDNKNHNKSYSSERSKWRYSAKNYSSLKEKYKVDHTSYKFGKNEYGKKDGRSEYTSKNNYQAEYQYKKHEDQSWKVSSDKQYEYKEDYGHGGHKDYDHDGYKKEDDKGYHDSSRDSDYDAYKNEKHGDYDHKDMNNDHHASKGGDKASYEISLSGKQEVPPVWTDMTGTFYVDDNHSSKDSVKYKLEVWKGDDVISAHIHCAPKGKNGPVVVGLFDDHRGEDVNGVLAEGVIRESDIKDVRAEENCPVHISNMEDLAMAAEQGYLYVNVHTKEYPNGEIRGQSKSGHMSYGEDKTYNHRY